MSVRPARASRHMARAFELARAVRGTTSPNPAVGAVIAHGSRIVGEGSTQPPGMPHAEVMALRQAGDQASGATMYVTLEPCAHVGRTPPCTEAIIETGIDRVVVAVGDPDRRVSGRGLAQLRDAGVEVSLGDGAALGADHYEAYAHHRRTGRPFVTAKFAASLDGRIASTSGDSRWISGPQTLVWAHRNRPLFDAILVGVETIIVDNPQLTARPEDWRGPIPQPLRVVLDSRGRTPLDSRVLQGTDQSPTLITTTDAADVDWRTSIAQGGVDIAVLPVDAERGGRVSLPAVLELLGQVHGVVSLLVEGGGEVLGSFFDQRLINKVTAVVAPMIIGGDAQAAVRGGGAERMRDVLRLNRMTTERLGSDLLITGYPVDPERELQVRVRPAGPDDEEDIDLLIASHLGAQAPGAEELLAAARLGEAVVWVAVAPAGGIETGTVSADGEEVLGVAAIAVGGEAADSRLAAIICLAIQTDAPQSAADRLRESCEASAAGREAEWLTCTLDQAPGLSDEQLKLVGYRYYRRNLETGDVLIKRL